MATAAAVRACEFQKQSEQKLHRSVMQAASCEDAQARGRAVFSAFTSERAVLPGLRRTGWERRFVMQKQPILSETLPLEHLQPDTRS